MTYLPRAINQGQGGEGGRQLFISCIFVCLPPLQGSSLRYCLLLRVLTFIVVSFAVCSFELNSCTYLYTF